MIVRKLGLIGGMSWASTALYYEAINKGVARRKGGLASAPLMIESLDFQPIVQLQAAGEWNAIADRLIESAQRLQNAGAEGLVLCSNMAHKHYDLIAQEIGIPILHIADVTAERLVKDKVKRAGLIGTRFTMTDNFYRDRIEAHGIEVAIPDAATMAEIDRIIASELFLGHVSRVSQRTLKTCLTRLGQARNQAVILGCTELVLLVDPGANVLPVYDTTALHSEAAVEWILGEEGEEGRPPLTAVAGAA
jgi:aspartate racemase